MCAVSVLFWWMVYKHVIPSLAEFYGITSFNSVGNEKFRKIPPEFCWTHYLLSYRVLFIYRFQEINPPKSNIIFSLHVYKYSPPPTRNKLAGIPPSLQLIIPVYRLYYLLFSVQFDLHTDVQTPRHIMLNNKDRIDTQICNICTGGASF